MSELKDQSQLLPVLCEAFCNVIARSIAIGKNDATQALGELVQKSVSMKPCVSQRLRALGQFQCTSAKSVVERLRRSPITGCGVQLELSAQTLAHEVANALTSSSLVGLAIVPSGEPDRAKLSDYLIVLASSVWTHKHAIAGRLRCPLCFRFVGQPAPRGRVYHQAHRGLQLHLTSQHNLGLDEATATALCAKQKGLSIDYVAEASVPPNVADMSVEERAFHAAETGNTAMLRELFDSSAGVKPAELRDKHGSTLLHWASGAGHEEVMQLLVEQYECSPTKESTGTLRTPLHWACRGGHMPAVKYLVETCGVDVRPQTSDGTTPLMWGVWKCHLEVCQYMVKMEALHVEHKECREQSWGLAHINNFGCSAWHWLAMSAGEDEPVDPVSMETKLNTEENAAVTVPRAVLVAEWLLQRKDAASPCSLNNAGHSALHKAAARGRMWFIQWLLRHTDLGKDATTLKCDADRRYASDYATMCGHEALAKLLQQLELPHNAS